MVQEASWVQQQFRVRLTPRGAATSCERTTTNLMELDLEILVRGRQFCSLLQVWEQCAVLGAVCGYFYVRKLSLFWEQCS